MPAGEAAAGRRGGAAAAPHRDRGSADDGGRYESGPGQYGHGGGADREGAPRRSGGGRAGAAASRRGRSPDDPDGTGSGSEGGDHAEGRRQRDGARDEDADGAGRARRRQLGMHARQRKRSEVASLEKELEDLKASLSANRNMQMCFSCTGLAGVLKSNPSLVQDLSSTHQNLKIVLQVIEQALLAGAARAHELPGLNAECVIVLHRLSELQHAAAWHGAALVVLHDGMMMNHPGLLVPAGDIPMASWLSHFLACKGPSLTPEAMAECAALLQSWTAFEDDLQVLMAEWTQTVHRNGVSRVTQDLTARLQQGLMPGSFILKPKPAQAAAGPSTSDEAGASQGLALLGAPQLRQPGQLEGDIGAHLHAQPQDKTQMPPELLCCCNIVQNNQRFRSLAIDIMQRKLNAEDFAFFLSTRLTMDNMMTQLFDHMKRTKAGVTPPP